MQHENTANDSARALELVYRRWKLGSSARSLVHRCWADLAPHGFLRRLECARIFPWMHTDFAGERSVGGTRV
ncbi:MAG: hypothetical protein B7Y67_19170 [Polynucleobacter sp. 35-46-11]|uniref:hypothetical protein n=1 Tax=Polynucleobacter sp. 35-46-11 TaxID=1970425 RepID=UPI000BD00B33|nr:hypothetical protein [Polynucleobacter sp. 35-46-11]OYY06261.1 MAG: hypothetical protein B7Y67_19170 [Polynucleobacter sp. 35-46-11]